MRGCGIAYRPCYFKIRSPYEENPYCKKQKKYYDATTSRCMVMSFNELVQTELQVCNSQYYDADYLRSIAAHTSTGVKEEQQKQQQEEEGDDEKVETTMDTFTKRIGSVIKSITTTISSITKYGTNHWTDCYDWCYGDCSTRNYQWTKYCGTNYQSIIVELYYPKKIDHFCR